MRGRILIASTVWALAFGWVATSAGAQMTAEEVVDRYLEARGGAETWRKVEAFALEGVFSAVSKRSDFSMIRQQGDLFRLDYRHADMPAIRARDAEGPWMLNAWLQPEAGRVDEDPYKRQLERESLFPLILLDYAKKGIEVELMGAGELEGFETINLKITLPDGHEETWYLDAETYREFAIDAQVYDYTQLREPMNQRTYFDDFREVDGLIFPFQIEWEFWARLETMTIEKITLNPRIDEARFSPPPAAEPTD